MDPTRPVGVGEDSDTADLFERARRATPAPEDHSTAHTDPVDDGPGSDALRAADQLPALAGIYPAAHVASSFARNDGMFMGAMAQNSQQGYTLTRITQHGSPSPFHPSSRRSQQPLQSTSGRDRAPVRSIQEHTSLSPSTRSSRSRPLLLSSERTVRDFDVIAPSIGTQRLMPPRDPMAAFYTEPERRLSRRSISPSPTRTSGFAVNEEQYRDPNLFPWVHTGSKKHRPASNIAADSARITIPKDDRQERQWRGRIEAAHLAKQRNEDRAKGLMPPPPPRIPRIPVSIRRPDEASRASLPLPFRLKLDGFEKAWEEEKRLNQLRAERRKAKRGEKKSQSGRHSPISDSSESDSSGSNSPVRNPPSSNSPAKNRPAWRAFGSNSASHTLKSTEANPRDRNTSLTAGRRSRRRKATTPVSEQNVAQEDRDSEKHSQSPGPRKRRHAFPSGLDPLSLENVDGSNHSSPQIMPTQPDSVNLAQLEKQG